MPETPLNPDQSTSGRRKPLTDEMLRILRAVDRGALSTNASARYVIAGEPRPDRKSREALVKRGYIVWVTDLCGPSGYRLTDLGREALR